MKQAEVLKRLIREKFRNVRNFSVKNDIPYSTVRSVLERGVENSGVNTVVKITEALGITMDELNLLAGGENIKGEYLMEEFIPYKPNTIRLPIVGIVRAGEPILAHDNIEGFFNIDSSVVKHNKDYFMLKVTGDSMDKEFKEDDLLLIEKTSCLENGDVGVIRINGNEATVKRFFREGNLIQLLPSSNNTDYVPQLIDIEKREIEIIGKVKLAVKKY